MRSGQFAVSGTRRILNCVCVKAQGSSAEPPKLLLSCLSAFLNETTPTASKSERSADKYGCIHAHEKELDIAGDAAEDRNLKKLGKSKTLSGHKLDVQKKYV